MRRAEAVRALIAAADQARAVSIVTEQCIGAWRQAVGLPLNEIPDHLEVVGAMGSASSIGLGVALAQPVRTVMVVDGDGSLLMQLGSLVTIAGAAAANLFHFVLENGVYETSGNQPLPGDGRFDLADMARAAGYAGIFRFSAGGTFADALSRVLGQVGPVFVSVRTEAEDGYLVRSSAGTRIDVQMQALRERLTAPGQHS